MNLSKTQVISKITYGLYIALMDPSILEMAKYCGYDFVRIDTEHSLYDIHAIANMIRTANLLGLTIFVRVADLAEITPILDFGADGIIVPGVDTKEKALEAIDKVKYAPLGHRGMSTCSRALQYSNLSGAKYRATANSKVMLMIQLESKASLQHLDDFLALEGIDMVGIGKNDLSQSLGISGDIDNPQITNAENLMIAKAIEYGKMPSIMTTSPSRIRDILRQGKGAITIGYDTKLVFQALKRQFNEMTAIQCC